MTATTLAAAVLPEPLSEDELARLDDESFTDYVQGCLPSAGLFLTLHKPAVVDRAVTALGVLLDDFNQVVHENREEVGAGEFRRWWATVGGPLRDLLQRRIARAKGAARGARETELRRAARRHREVLGRLAEEIHVHRLAVLAAGVEPEAHDRAMWAALAALTIPVGGEDVRLDEALGRGLIGGVR